jgi:hypothetical protein
VKNRESKYLSRRDRFIFIRIDLELVCREGENANSKTQTSGGPT